MNFFTHVDLTDEHLNILTRRIQAWCHNRQVMKLVLLSTFVLACLTSSIAPAATVNNSRQNLTGEECTALGGETKTTTDATCPSAKYCTRTGQDGKIFRVCIEKNTSVKVTKPTANPAKPVLPAKPGSNAAAPPTGKMVKGGVTIGVPLTQEECKGLGGVVQGSRRECGAQLACSTTDRFGVIRVACIDEIAR